MRKKKAAIRNRLNANTGDVVLIVADASNNVVFDSLGQLRCELAKKLELIDESLYNLLWVTDFPLFEYDEENNRYAAKHHPFTAVSDEDMDKIESDPAVAMLKPTIWCLTDAKWAAVLSESITLNCKVGCSKHWALQNKRHINALVS